MAGLSCCQPNGLPLGGCIVVHLAKLCCRLKTAAKLLLDFSFIALCPLERLVPHL